MRIPDPTAITFDIRNRADEFEFHSLHVIRTVFPGQAGNPLSTFSCRPGGAASQTFTSRGFGGLPRS
jgi:hypothetical protein